METFFVPCGYTEADIQTYFATDYSDEKVQGWIEDPKKHVSLAIETSSYAIAGYLVIDGPTELPHKDVHEKSPELKKLYVDEKFKGKGIAKTLMETGLRWLNTEDCPYEGDLFISVFRKTTGDTKVLPEIWGRENRRVLIPSWGRDGQGRGVADIAWLDRSTGQGRMKHVISQICPRMCKKMPKHCPGLGSVER